MSARRHPIGVLYTPRSAWSLIPMSRFGGSGPIGLSIVFAVFASACAAPTELETGEGEQALGAPATPSWAECADGKPTARFVVELSSGSCTKLPTKLGAAGRWEGRTLAREGGRATCEARWVWKGMPTIGSAPDYSILTGIASHDEHDVLGRKAIVPMCGAQPACGTECSPREPRLHVDPSVLATVRPIALPPLAASTTPPRVVPIDKMGGCGACAAAHDGVAYIYLRPEMVAYEMPLELVLSYRDGEETAALPSVEQSYAVSLATRLDGRARTTPLPDDTSAWVRVRTR